jgi:hypothetical protein
MDESGEGAGEGLRLFWTRFFGSCFGGGILLGGIGEGPADSDGTVLSGDGTIGFDVAGVAGVLGEMKDAAFFDLLYFDHQLMKLSL